MLSDYIFIVIPAIVFILFIACLVSYISALRANKKKPDSFAAEQIKLRKTACIVTGIIAGIMLAVIIGILILFAMVIAYM